jgi:hypothetical protein
MLLTPNRFSVFWQQEEGGREVERDENGRGEEEARQHQDRREREREGNQDREGTSESITRQGSSGGAPGGVYHR